jgi:hypothetical protein
MSTHVTQSQSQSLNPISRGNGQVSNQPPISTDKKYKLEDFSQQAINRGQVEINFLLTVVNGRVDDALKQLRNAVWQLAHCGQVDFNTLDKAIAAVREANQKVAGPYPPGCGPLG